jgi:hypothetical protein
MDDSSAAQVQHASLLILDTTQGNYKNASNTRPANGESKVSQMFKMRLKDGQSGCIIICGGKRNQRV